MSVFLWAILFLIFGIVHFISCFVGDLQYSNSVLNEASLYVILFCIVYLITRKCTKTKNNSNVIDINIDKSGRNDKFYKILVVVLLVVVAIQSYSLITSAGGLSNTSWGSMRNSTSNQNYLSYSQMFITLFFAASSCLLLALANKDKKKTLIVIALIIFEVIISRNRIEILPLFCSILLLYISKIKKINIKQIVLLALIAILVIYSVYGLRVFRHYGTLDKFINEFDFAEFNGTIASYIQNDDGELGLKNYFYYFIDNNNNFEAFGEGHTYKRMLLVWLPTRWSLGMKPDDFAISMGKAVLPSSDGFSVHPTLFGDCYANFGFLGFVLMGIFWAIYASVLDYIVKIQKNPNLRYALMVICCVTYIIIGRGSIYNGFVWQFFGIIILILLNFALKIKIKVH